MKPLISTQSFSKLRPKTKDHIATWYEVREELGVSDTIHLFFLNKKNGHTDFESFRHRDMDGIAMLSKALKHKGYQTPPTPMNRDSYEPSLRHVLKQRKLIPQDRWPKQVPWRNISDLGHLNQPKTTDASHTESLPAIEKIERQWLVLIKQTAQAQNVSTASLMLSCLNKAVFDELLTDNGTVYWFYPVNMRGPIKNKAQSQNLSSGFYLPLNALSSAQEIHQQVKQRLAAQHHWYLWKMAHIGKWVGRIGVKWLYRSISQSQFHMGSFSYLGEWSMPNHPDLLIGCCGPGSANYPISTGITECNGEMTLALKFHPSMPTESVAVERCLHRWIYHLQQEIEQDV